MSLWHRRDLSLDLLGHGRSLRCLQDISSDPRICKRFQISTATLGTHQWCQTGERRTKIRSGMTLITPGRRPHPLRSCRQNTLILTYSAVAWTAGMVPVLFDLPRQALSLFAAHFLRSLSQPDTRRSRDASQSSINVLPWLREENMLSQPCRLLRRWDTLSSCWKSPRSRRSVWLAISPPASVSPCILLLFATHPATFQVSYRSVLRRGIALVLQMFFLQRKISSFHRYWWRRVLI